MQARVHPTMRLLNIRIKTNVAEPTYSGSSEMLKEQHLRDVEKALNDAIRFADMAGMHDDELVEMLNTLISTKDM